MRFERNHTGSIALIGVYIGTMALIAGWVNKEFTFWGVEGAFQTPAIDGVGAGDIGCILALIGVIGAAAMVLIEFLGLGQTATRAILAVMGLLMIAGSVIVWAGVDSVTWAFAIGTVTKTSVWFGLYMEMIAGIIVMTASILGLLKILPEPK